MWQPMMLELSSELQRRIGVKAEQKAKLQGGKAATACKQGTVARPFQLSVSRPRAVKASQAQSTKPR